MFSLEQLVFAMASDQRSNAETLAQILPILQDVCKKEATLRQELKVRLKPLKFDFNTCYFFTLIF